jgi:hypothetical protein
MLRSTCDFAKKQTNKKKQQKESGVLKGVNKVMHRNLK